jgi:hypothetical protein
MNFISKVGFETRPLLNKEEYPVLLLLEEVVREIGGGFRVMAQTSLGEVIRPSRSSASKDDRDLAFRSINSKRLDFSIFDRFGRLVLAVEYQGSGHYHSTSFIRDAVKKEALRKAGVTLLEVPIRFRADDVKRQVLQLLIAPATRQSIPRRAANSEQTSHTRLDPL